jgi:hypothetical protein
MADEPEKSQAIGEDPSRELVNKNKRYRKPKPWDTDDIDHVSPHPNPTCKFLLIIFCYLVENRAVYKRRQH